MERWVLSLNWKMEEIVYPVHLIIQNRCVAASTIGVRAAMVTGAHHACLDPIPRSWMEATAFSCVVLTHFWRASTYVGFLTWWNERNWEWNTAYEKIRAVGIVQRHCAAVPVPFAKRLDFSSVKVDSCDGGGLCTMIFRLSLSSQFTERRRCYWCSYRPTGRSSDARWWTLLSLTSDMNVLWYLEHSAINAFLLAFDRTLDSVENKYWPSLPRASSLQLLVSTSLRMRSITMKA